MIKQADLESASAEKLSAQISSAEASSLTFILDDAFIMNFRLGVCWAVSLLALFSVDSLLVGMFVVVVSVVVVVESFPSVSEIFSSIDSMVNLARSLNISSSFSKLVSFLTVTKNGNPTHIFSSLEQTFEWNEDQCLV